MLLSAERWQAWGRALLVIALLGCVPSVALTPAVGAADSGPLLVLEPDRGRCAAVVTARGAGFPAGAPVRFFTRQVGTDNGAEIPRAETTVAADGTFSRPLPFVGFGCDQSATVPEGTQFRITARIGGGRPDGTAELAASATYTVTATPQRCFAGTGHCIGGRIRAYWEAHGLDLGDPGISDREAVALFGFPLTDEFVQTLEDGKPYTVQYFERARMEYHPENPLPHDLLLGQFGRRLRGLGPPEAPSPGARHFPETGQNLGGRFLAFWEANGGLPIFGLPLTGAIVETLENGQPHTVQYFERTRLEWHPTNPEPYQILIGHFGRQILERDRQPAGSCRGVDLAGTVGWSVLGGAATATILVVNTTPSPCELPAHPLLEILDARGAAVPIDQSAYYGADNTVTLRQQQGSYATLTWRNWCRAMPERPLAIRLTLPGNDGQFSPASRSPGIVPPCDDPAAPSTVAIEGFAPRGPGTP